MPYTTRADGDVLTASSHNANCRDQVISTVTSATRPAGTEGQFIYETDTDLVYGYNGGWVLFGGLGAWVSFTPTVTQSSTITNTVTYARYMKIGRTVFCAYNLALTSAGSANTVITVTAPVTAATSSVWTGSGVVYDASTTTLFPMIPVLTTTGVFSFSPAEGNHTVNVYEGMTGGGFAAAVASGDIISFTAMYESAA